MHGQNCTRERLRAGRCVRGKASSHRCDEEPVEPAPAKGKFCRLCDRQRNAPVDLTLWLDTHDLSAVIRGGPVAAIRIDTGTIGSSVHAARIEERNTFTWIRLDLAEFFMPLRALRDRKKGYAVSMIKAGADLVGHPAGPVRAPLTDLTQGEREVLAGLVARAGSLLPQMS